VYGRGDTDDVAEAIRTAWRGEYGRRGGGSTDDVAEAIRTAWRGEYGRRDGDGRGKSLREHVDDSVVPPNETDRKPAADAPVGA